MVVAEDPKARGWSMPSRSKRFHYFIGKFNWSLSLCNRVHVSIGRLHLKSDGDVEGQPKCWFCQRRKAEQEETA